MLPELHVSLLGNFQLRYGSQAITTITSSRQQALIAYLILLHDAPVSRLQLASLFWPETTEAQARTNLRNLLHKLHQSFHFFDEFIEVDTKSLRWRQDAPYTLDVVTFESCLEGKPGTPIQRDMLEQAVQVYAGDLLPDCYDDWIDPIRERLRRSFLSALDTLAAITEEAREYSSALEYVQRLVAADPLNASKNYHLIYLYALLGDRTAAIKAYRVYSRQLSEELGTEPEAEIQELVSRLQHPMKQEVVPKETAVLVGRKTEWHKVLSTWHSALAGQAQMLIISGEAGIGKTRLVEELAYWAALQGIQVVSAYCYPAEGNLPYTPVVSWLRARPMPHLEKVWLTELARLLPEVRQNFSGLSKEEPLREAWQRQRLFEALARALLARKQAQLLILEDIHWCDQDTLEWLHYLFRFAPSAPLLVVATVRSGEVAQEHPLMLLQSVLREEGRLVDLQIQPLSEPETIQLANQIRMQNSGQSLSAEEANEVYREAEGNPLFAIEMVRLGSVQPCPEPPCGDWLAASERVQSVLSRRIRQVNSGTREITCLAATIGREFNLEVMRYASQGSDEHLVRAIDELLQRQIIREISPETYDFTHDLLRQAAFDGMSTAHRRLLHRKIAEAYQQLDLAAQYPRDAEIASHYERAGLFLQAVHHYHLAAETAASTFANADAERYLRHAIALAESIGVGRVNGLSTEVFADILERLGDLLALDGKYTEAQGCFERALAQKRSVTYVWQAQVYRKIGDAWVPQYNHALAHQALDQAEQSLCFSEETGSLEERQERLQIQLSRMQLHYWEGRVEMMEIIFQQIEPEIKAIGRTDQYITLLSMQFMTRLRQERYRLSVETVEIAQRRLELTQKFSSAFEQAVATFQVGFGFLWYGDPSAARLWLARAQDATAQVGTRTWQARSLTYLSIADRELGNLDSVREETQQMFELCYVLNEYTYQGIGLSNLGWLAFRQGDMEQAERLCNEAKEVWQKLGGTVFYWLADWVLLAIAVARRDFVLAARAAQTFVNPRPTDQPPLKPAANHVRQAISAWQAGDEEGTLAFYNLALDEARAAHEL